MGGGVGEVKPWLYPDVCTAYIKESGRVRTADSKETYRQILRLLQSAHPHKRIDQFTQEELTRFCLTRFDGRAGLPASHTIGLRRTILSSVWDWAHWRGIVKANPATALKFTVQAPRKAVRLGTWLTEEQVVKVLEASHTGELYDERNRIVVMVGVFTGLRRGEIASLRWPMFDSSLSTVTVVGKGNKPAYVPIPPELQAALAEWRTRCPGDVLFPTFRSMLNGTERELVPFWDRPIGVDGVHKAVRAAAEKAGLDVNPHDLRRTIAGILDARGVEMKDIQRLLRHESVAVTEGYLAKNPARARAIMDGFRLGV